MKTGFPVETAVTSQQREVGTKHFSFSCIVYSVFPEHDSLMSVLSSVGTFSNAGAHINFCSYLTLESCPIRERNK